MQSLGQGATFSELSVDALASIPITVPSLSQQQTIADYLDKETALIDSLVSKKRGLEELLHERRRALIMEAVAGEE